MCTYSWTQFSWQIISAFRHLYLVGWPDKCQCKHWNGEERLCGIDPPVVGSMPQRMYPDKSVSIWDVFGPYWIIVDNNMCYMNYSSHLKVSLRTNKTSWLCYITFRKQAGFIYANLLPYFAYSSCQIEYKWQAVWIQVRKGKEKWACSPLLMQSLAMSALDSFWLVKGRKTTNNQLKSP